MRIRRSYYSRASAILVAVSVAFLGLKLPLLNADLNLALNTCHGRPQSALPKVRSAQISGQSSYIGEVLLGYRGLTPGVSDGIANNTAVLFVWLTAAAAVLCAAAEDYICKCSNWERPPGRKRKRKSPASIAVLFDITAASLWFHTTYWILYSIKASLNDTLCAPSRTPSYPNGVSGHYCYFGFTMFTVPLIVQRCAARCEEAAACRTTGANNSQGRAYSILKGLIELFQTVFCWFAFDTLTRTYAHGYHTARHVMFGASLALLSATAFEISLSWSDPSVDSRLENPNPFSKARFRRPILCAALGLKGVVSYTLCTALWPSSVVGSAIGRNQLIPHLMAWVLLLALTWSLQHTSPAVELIFCDEPAEFVRAGDSAPPHKLE